MDSYLELTLVICFIVLTCAGLALLDAGLNNSARDDVIYQECVDDALYDKYKCYEMIYKKEEQLT